MKKTGVGQKNFTGSNHNDVNNNNTSTSSFSFKTTTLPKIPAATNGTLEHHNKSVKKKNLPPTLFPSIMATDREKFKVYHFSVSSIYLLFSIWYLMLHPLMVDLSSVDFYARRRFPLINFFVLRPNLTTPLLFFVRFIRAWDRETLGCLEKKECFTLNITWKQKDCITVKLFFSGVC